MNKWTKQEEEKLINEYNKNTNDQLEKMFKRSFISIYKKARKLNLYRDKNIEFINRSNCRKGELSSNWKGGRRKTKKGYILIKVENHPYASASKLIQEHRVIMEKHIGRYLTKNEVVHHKNGIKDDNRIENLELMDFGKHTELHNTNRKKSTETKEKISKKAKERFLNYKNHPSYKNINTDDITNRSKILGSVQKACDEYGITTAAYYKRLRRGII